MQVAQSGLWVFWPDYSHDNPYQTLVRRAFPPGWEVRSAGLGTALAALGAARGPVVFHLHWEDAIYREARQAEEAERLAEHFLAGLDRFLAAGGRFAWTVHNAQPHEPRFPELDRRLRRALAERAHAVQMHSPAAVAEMAPALGLAPETVLVTPHGGYTGYYPDDIGRAAARRYFGLDPEAPVFVTLGNLRPYKGIEVLQAAFAALRARLPEARLIIAGRSGTPAFGRFREPSPGVLLMPDRIDDATVQYVLRAADFAVFSFRRIMTSGSVLLAQSFGLPVIVPDLPTLAEMVEPGRNGFTYPAGDAVALARVMLGAAGLPPASRAALSEGALAEIAQRDWGHYAAALVRAATEPGRMPATVPAPA
ncbi:glycosyltransferase family 4 protein [Crenalkalicoccus roseus]|uniref:glycosyltransferase family 4 protein n=1 Tax=Crenalkalicoccus roseus TaxID=1485588 RepID=UPI0010820F80|nr:glycosyltransferase family 4 protein [Crenalkalicoccus roseus]